MGPSGFAPRNKKYMTSERMKKLQENFDKSQEYSINEAVPLIKQLCTANFDESIELHVRLGIDPKQGDQQVRSSTVLPNGTGKDKKVAAFVGRDKEDEAKEAGADFVYGEPEIENIRNTKKIEFDVAVATPDMMPKVAKAGPVLGPRGLMPSPKTGTVSDDVAKVIKELKQGKIEFRNDDTGNIHQVIGNESFNDEDLIENVKSFIEDLKNARPDGVKGIFIKGAYLTSTMGPSIKLDINTPEPGQR